MQPSTNLFTSSTPNKRRPQSISLQLSPCQKKAKMMPVRLKLRQRFQIMFQNKYLNLQSTTHMLSLRLKPLRKPRETRLQQQGIERKEERDAEAEVESEVSTAAGKEAEKAAEAVMAVAEVVATTAEVVAVTGLDKRMRTVSSLKLETNPSQEEEAAEVVSVARVVSEAIVVSAEVKEVSTAAIAATDVAATAPRRRELLSQLSNNSNHNNE